MTDNVTIYEVIGWTARIDWSGSSVKKSLGLFVSEASAKVEIDLIKIAVSTPPISNFNSPKSAYLDLSTPFVVRDTFRCVGIRPCG